METLKILTICFLVLGLLAYSMQSACAEPMGTAFTYQGQLYDEGYPANGQYDFAFKLYDAGSDGNKVGTDVNVAEVNVVDGYFTAELDFGGDVFNGSAVWLEVGVRLGDQNDLNVYTVLLPRQEVAAVPYSMQTHGIFVDSNGNVGIGTTSPSERLKVIGTVNSTGGFATGDTATLQNGWLRVYGLTPNDLIFKVGGSGPPSSPTQGTEIMRLTETGRLGIGTTNPTEALEVNGTVKANAFVGDGSSLTNLSPTPDSDWVISDSNMYSGVSGNVGIGTTSSVAKLTVSTDLGGPLSLDYSSANAVGMLTFHRSGTLKVSHVLESNDDYGVWVNGDRRLTMTTAGNVGIGTTSPTAKLQIGGTAGVDGIKFPDGTIQTTAYKDGSRFQLYATLGTFTFTAPIGVTKVYITAVAGGGGGGGFGSFSGGGGGEACIKYPHSVTGGNNYTVTVGNGGDGGDDGNPFGGNGGNTVFGNLTLTGGSVGSIGYGGAGGGIPLDGLDGSDGGSGGGQCIKGGNGGNAVGTLFCGGGGGGTVFGRGGAGGDNENCNGSNGTGYGSGGGGAGACGGGGYSGGNGRPGFVLVEW